MAAEWLEADLAQFYILAELVDLFWRKPTAYLAAEVRQQQARFGLDPLARRRLEWEVERPEKARAPERIAAPPQAGEDDPRRVLQMPARGPADGQ